MTVTKELTILALTKMRGGVCTAGIDGDGQWVRPVRPHAENKPRYDAAPDYCLLPLDFFHGGHSHLVNLGVTRFWFASHTPRPPHNEDWTMELARKPQLIRKLTAEEQERFLAASVEDGLPTLDGDILQTVAEFGGRLGRTLIADVLAGSKSKRIAELNLDQADHYGALRLHTQERALKWIDELIAQLLLKTTAEEYPRLMITGRGAEALNGKTLLALSGFAQSGARPATDETTIEQRDNAAGSELIRAPKQWRLQVEIWRQGGAEPDRETLLNLLREMQAGERDDLITVIGALKDLNAVEAGEYLLTMLGETTNGNLINAICDALGHLGVEGAAGALIELLDDERQGARRIAARALGRLRARPALSKLERLAATDAAESVRIAGAAAWRIKADLSD